MIADTFARFASLRAPIRSLVSLYWIYTFILSFTGIFTQIFLYSRFQSLSVNVLALMLFYTGGMLSFCVFGYLASIFSLNIRLAYIFSFIAIAFSFILLLLVRNTEIAYIALFVSGVGDGFFWLALHTFELSETKDSERDFYASLLSMGDGLLSLLGPACATALIWLSGSIFHLGTFTLIFATAPIIYLSGLFLLRAVSVYRPKLIKHEDVAYFFTSKRNRAMQLNVAGEAVGDAIQTAAFPAALLVILGTALLAGFYTTVIGIGSLLCVVAVAKYRRLDNRFIILSYSTLATVLVLSWLAHVLTLPALIVYGIIICIAGPLMSVSTRAITLRAMESNKRDESDFYASMILRDFSLWVWRIVFGGMFLLIMSAQLFQHTNLSVGLYFSAIGMIITLLGARTIVVWK